jgi:hypothetical protein
VQKGMKESDPIWGITLGNHITFCNTKICYGECYDYML